MDPEDPDSDPDHSHNVIISSFYLFRHILKISSQSIHMFLSYLVHKQTDGQTNPGENITFYQNVKYIEPVMTPNENITFYQNVKYIEPVMTPNERNILHSYVGN